MSNRTDWENVADEIEGLDRARLVTELHNAFVAGQESVDEETPRKRITELEELLGELYKTIRRYTPEERAAPGSLMARVASALLNVASESEPAKQDAAGDETKPHEHVWQRTGSDTLFCFGCKTAVNEPEDK